MCYQNGKKILPPPLLSAIQEYIDGEYIYIPRKTNNKRPWGSTKGTKQQTAERNQEIFCCYLSGIPVTVLAEEYFLSSKASSWATWTALIPTPIVWQMISCRRSTAGHWPLWTT